MNKLEKLVVSPLRMEMNAPSSWLLFLKATDLQGDAVFPKRNGNWDIFIELIHVSQSSSNL